MPVVLLEPLGGCEEVGERRVVATCTYRQLATQRAWTDIEVLDHLHLLRLRWAAAVCMHVTTANKDPRERRRGAHA